jgi:hypothetical protein
VIEKLAPATREALAKCVDYEGTVTKISGAAKVRSIERDGVGRGGIGLTCIVISCVDALDVIPLRSTQRLRNCFLRRVREGEACVVVQFDWTKGSDYYSL